ncbi:MAG TPA: hypothetical protein VKR56_00105 [Candidatus Cybelea sp.]|nr:hypothetical protein [Candidatus Cybelea sp.]
MRTLGIVLLLSVCGVVGLTAQTPAPVSSSGKPLRHLEYSFNVSVEGLQNYTIKGANGVQTVDKAGNVVAPEGGSGTLFADILSVAPDGALVVRISELVQGEPRPRAAYTCNVYGNTSVFCPSAATPGAAEWLLLSYLGRQFIDAAPWDAQGHWQRKEQSAEFNIEEDFTLVDAGDGKKVVVREIKTTQLHNGGFDNQTSDITINYDRAMEVPDIIRADVATAGGTEASSASYVFTLTHDSFAKPAH